MVMSGHTIKTGSPPKHTSPFLIMAVHTHTHAQSSTLHTVSPSPPPIQGSHRTGIGRNAAFEVGKRRARRWCATEADRKKPVDRKVVGPEV